MVEMTIAAVTLDALKRPVVVLKNGQRILPIWIGDFEARAIAYALENRSFERPLTHDLIGYILKGFQATVSKIQVYKLENGTYYAYLIVSQQQDDSESKQMLKIDCRPSDALALATRFSAPILVAEKVLEQGGQDVSILEEDEEEGEEEDTEDTEGEL